MNIKVYFSDTDVVFECEEGKRFSGDAPVDSFRSWWRHVGAEHPEVAE